MCYRSNQELQSIDYRTLKKEMLRSPFLFTNQEISVSLHIFCASWSKPFKGFSKVIDLIEIPLDLDYFRPGECFLIGGKTQYSWLSSFLRTRLCLVRSLFQIHWDKNVFLLIVIILLKELFMNRARGGSLIHRQLLIEFLYQLPMIFIDKIDVFHRLDNVRSPTI